jgi:hypothetical protein
LKKAAQPVNFLLTRAISFSIIRSLVMGRLIVGRQHQPDPNPLSFFQLPVSAVAPSAVEKTGLDESPTATSDRVFLRTCVNDSFFVQGVCRPPKAFDVEYGAVSPLLKRSVFRKGAFLQVPAGTVRGSGRRICIHYEWRHYGRFFI